MASRPRQQYNAGMATDLILGTAGHIDHGKTSLIRALTGIDTDRLPEEKRRGITIELGFAHLEIGPYRLGVVDVPGHERFVRNMLAGATGMDLAMLVVAADDSVKPQTREHLEILRLLDLPAGVIALTKCDLADDQWIELVEEEVRELVAGTFLEDAPIVRTSAATGQGLDELKAALEAAAARAAASQRMQLVHAPFRMAIDRAFTLAGHGTIVTGSVASGRVRVGDELEIQPDRILVRVRSLQNHDRPADEVHRGQRAAINLAGVHHDQIRRGHELATPGHLVPSRLLTVQLTLLPEAPRPLKNRTRVRLHVGTAELLAIVRLLDRERLEPGQSALAQLFLNQPAATVWHQPFVIRSESPVHTIGGGRVLDPNAQRIRKPNEQLLQMVGDLSSADPIQRAAAAIYFAGLRPWDPRDLSRTAGVDDGQAAHRQLAERGVLRRVVISPTRTVWLHAAVFDGLCQRVEALLLRLHQQNPLATGFDRRQLASRFAYLGDPALVDAVLSHLQQTGRVRLTERTVALAGQGPKLSQSEQKVLEQLVEIFRTAGLKPPTVKECQQAVQKNRESVPQLLELAVANGQLVKIADDFYLHADVESQVRQKLQQALADSDGMTMSQIRELLETSRKYAVPLCEYYDQIGVTKRVGDLRVLGDLQPDPHLSPG